MSKYTASDNVKVSILNNMFSLKQLLFMVITALLSITLLSEFYINLSEKQEAEQNLNFKLTSEEIGAAIKNEISINIEVLNSINALYSVSENVSREQFRVFNLNALNRITSIQALEFSPKIAFNEKGLYESNAHDDGLLDFFISEKVKGKMVPADNRDYYFPVYYMEPLIGNEKALGFDLASNPIRKSAIERAIETDNLIATAKINLIQEKENQNGILVFSAIKREGKTLGLVLAVYRVEDLIKRAISNINHSKCNLFVYDISAKKDEQLLVHFSEKKSLTTENNQNFNIPNGLHHHEKIKIADREWMLLTTPTQNYIYKFSTANNLIFIMFIILSSALIFYLFDFIRKLNREKAHKTLLQAIVIERTTEKEILKSIVDSQEQVRTNLSKNIHEGLAQTLSGLSYYINDIESELKEINNNELSESIDKVKRHLNEGIVETRSLAIDLMPRSLVEGGLTSSLQNHINDYVYHYKVELLSTLNEKELDIMVEITIYRTILKILARASESDKVKTVSIKLTNDKKLSFMITIVGDFYIEMNEKGDVIDKMYLATHKTIEIQNGKFYLNQKKNTTIISATF